MCVLFELSDERESAFLGLLGWQSHEYMNSLIIHSLQLVEIN